jgi:hypothetical protein
MTSNMKACMPSEIYKLLPCGWPGLAKTCKNTVLFLKKMVVYRYACHVLSMFNLDTPHHYGANLSLANTSVAAGVHFHFISGCSGFRLPTMKYVACRFFLFLFTVVVVSACFLYNHCGVVYFFLLKWWLI